jgi:hypothetical protein
MHVIWFKMVRQNECTVTIYTGSRWQNKKKQKKIRVPKKVIFWTLSMLNRTQATLEHFLASCTASEILTNAQYIRK